MVQEIKRTCDKCGKLEISTKTAHSDTGIKPLIKEVKFKLFERKATRLDLCPRCRSLLSDELKKWIKVDPGSEQPIRIEPPDQIEYPVKRG